MKEIKLPCHGVIVALTENGEEGTITSDLHEIFLDGNLGGCGNDAYGEGVVRAIENMILGHAIAGIDIESPAYIEGIETAVDSCAQNI